MMYTKGIGLFFGLSAEVFAFELRAFRKPLIVSSSLYLLSVNLNLSGDASTLSGSSFVQIVENEIHDSFYESSEYLPGVARCSI